MQTFLVKVEHQITIWRVSDVLCSAFEGGSAYWAQIRKTNKPSSWPNTAEKDRAYLHEYPCNPGGWVMIGSVDGGRARKLDLKAIERGLRVMAKDHPGAFSLILHEDDDANTADTFLQCCLFGKEIYG